MSFGPRTLLFGVRWFFEKITPLQSASHKNAAGIFRLESAERVWAN
jgi:hypothetical protein